MRKITLIFMILLLVLMALLWNLASDINTFNSGIKNSVSKISQIKKEEAGLVKYKSEKPLYLEKFYLEVFDDIKEISFYYRAPVEVKIVAAKNLVNIRNFFRESRYKGIKQVDITCSFDLRKQRNTYLLDTLYKVLKSRPLSVMDVCLEKGFVSVTMRLYGI
ncbi:MAG: hypothetical protein C4533_00075 [Candidatus Omnitrophota bacterium]|jgi:hypothetical protein|nr:MAG: hypothetical protein C4533_00075 [Candidatus Omnitrophota bacterium]